MATLEIIEAMSVQVFNESLKKFCESHRVMSLQIFISQSNECHGYILWLPESENQPIWLSESENQPIGQTVGDIENATGGNIQDVKCEICGSKGWKHRVGCARIQSTGVAM